METVEGGRSAKVLIALLGANRAIRGRLRSGLAECGIEIAVEDSLSSFARSGADLTGVQAVLVDLEHATDRDLDGLDALINATELPLMFSEAAHRGGNKHWMQSIAEKLRATVAAEPAPAEPGDADTAARAAPEPTRIRCPVWVLGASFGGPEAVKRFLSVIDEVPDAVFILAQHIGEGFAEVLAQQLHRSTTFRVTVAEEGAPLNSGEIYVAPVFHRLHIDEQDCLHLVPFRPERISYSPCIDDVMREVADRYGPRSGAIIFSGMGDDGTEGCRAMVRAGGVVWAQDSESCSIDSMPVCARATGLVSHIGNPEQLAGDLVRHLKADAESGAEAFKRG